MADSKFRLVSAASTNLTKVKDLMANLSGWYVVNTNAAIRYLKFYDQNNTPTVGTDVPTLTVQLPASSAVAYDLSPVVMFKNSMWIATTTGVSDTDSTAVGAGDLYIHVFYE